MSPPPNNRNGVRQSSQVLDYARHHSLPGGIYAHLQTQSSGSLVSPFLQVYGRLSMPPDTGIYNIQMLQEGGSEIGGEVVTNERVMCRMAYLVARTRRYPSF
ncbi:hypothetical protein VN97_g7175 [Penicillium thymicola]|uniref:Uncharacterized protein n=1 Tax=Penicillium thymicola TaxID=293382 RepID=A0AAI9X7A5_PENTH|nr:hypothetical protein VN97_g7175 [Penicillium thymicola]